MTTAYCGLLLGAKEANQEVLNGLYRLLGIYNYPAFKVGVDYREQIEEAKAAAEAADPIVLNETSFDTDDSGEDSE